MNEVFSFDNQLDFFLLSTLISGICSTEDADYRFTSELYTRLPDPECKKRNSEESKQQLEKFIMANIDKEKLFYIVYGICNGLDRRKLWRLFQMHRCEMYLYRWLCRQYQIVPAEEIFFVEYKGEILAADYDKNFTYDEPRGALISRKDDKRFKVF